MSRRSSLHGGYAIFLLPGLLAFLVVIVGPFLATVAISFTKWNGVQPPKWIGPSNYVTLLSDPYFLASFQNTFVLLLAMVVIPTILGLLLAGLLYSFVAPKFGPKTASFFRAGFYLPQVMPVAVAGVVWGWILTPDGALNSILQTAGLGVLAQNWLGNPDLALFSVMGMMVWFQIGFPLVIFFTAFQRMDQTLTEAAALDGASGWQTFIHVTVHQIRPEIFVVVLMTTIATFKVFAQVFVLTRGGPGTATYVPSYYTYLNFFQKDLVGLGSAVATIVTVVVLIVAVVFINFQARRDLAEEL
ncbi:MAG: sugar ABC transporter permease [Candidatus Limnocylindrales bacterium]|jgi:raffinose/stachyose/melibiose transport system permease protein